MPSDAIAAIVARGRRRFRDFILTMPADRRPIAWESVVVVCREDFIEHTGACLVYVEETRKPLFILCANGTICLTISPLPQQQGKPWPSR